MPREMRCDEYQIQRPNTNLDARPQIQENRQQLIEPPSAKRKCIENNGGNGARYTANDSTKSNQLAVIGKRSTARLSKSVGKIGSQISIQKVALSMQSANVTAPSTGGATQMATKTANLFEIKNVQSLLKKPATADTITITAIANDASNVRISSDDQQKKKKIGINTENGLTKNGAIKKVRLVAASKIPGPGPGRRMNVLVPSIPADQVNAQSTPIVKKLNLVPQDPLAIDETTTTATLAIDPSINAENFSPAFVREIAVIQTNKQLSTSSPMASSVSATPLTPTTPQTNGILTRSRNILEHPKPLYECDSCAFTSEVKQNLMRHNLVHTGKKQQLCKTCEKRFPSKSLLLAHMREYHHELHSDLAYWDIN